jgi:hypothetical protein
MAGAYCKFCNNRCFVYRILPDGPQKGWAGHLATCAPGMEHDREEDRSRPHHRHQPGLS